MRGSFRHLFHYNEYNEPHQRWACFLRDDESQYWTGGLDRWGSAHQVKIAYGATPEEAWQNMISLDELASEL